MGRIVLLLEERSMKSFLDGLLPRLFPGLPFLCVPHQGKQDLEKSIARKLRAWEEKGVRFVVVRDNDGADCLKVKRKLRGLCKKGGRPETLVRIACQELEAWYLGDLGALGTANRKPHLASLSAKAKYRNPDKLSSAVSEIEKLVPEFQKVLGARLMGERLTSANNSRSFKVFLEGIERLASGGSRQP